MSRRRRATLYLYPVTDHPSPPNNLLVNLRGTGTPTHLHRTQHKHRPEPLPAHLCPCQTFRSCKGRPLQSQRDRLPAPQSKSQAKHNQLYCQFKCKSPVLVKHQLEARQEVNQVCENYRKIHQLN